MVNEYFRSFVLGSSYLTTLPFFSAAQNIPPSVRNYSYSYYTLVAPLYFGLMNVLSLYMANLYNIPLRDRLILISLVSPIIVIAVLGLIDGYNYTTQQWIRYVIYIFIKHFFAYNVIIYFMETNI